MWESLSIKGSDEDLPRSPRRIPGAAMNKPQRWSQPEDGRSPVTGMELVDGPTRVNLPTYYEWPGNDPNAEVAVYHAQMVHCGACRQLLNTGESCEHLAFDGSPGNMVRVLQSGIYQIGWRSFSPQHVKDRTP